jgi:hypothetical protein
MSSGNLGAIICGGTPSLTTFLLAKLNLFLNADRPPSCRTTLCFRNTNADSLPLARGCILPERLLFLDFSRQHSRQAYAYGQAKKRDGDKLEKFHPIFSLIRQLKEGWTIDILSHEKKEQGCHNALRKANTIPTYT